jgi:hypothetical protein
MRRYVASLALSLFAFALLVAPAWSQEPGQRGQAKPQAGPGPAVDDEPPMSIFNDQVRRFKFRLEHDVASWETAEAFMQRYRKPNSPRIIGAYPDSETNSLIVIGPPEAEQAIRESLAEWLVESGGLGLSPSLAMQLRLLQQERTKLLAYMAEIEVQQVRAAATPAESAKVPQLEARLAALAADLEIVEQQIRVVRKYIQRIEQDDAAAAAGGGP